MKNIIKIAIIVVAFYLGYATSYVRHRRELLSQVEKLPDTMALDVLFRCLKTIKAQGWHVENLSEVDMENGKRVFFSLIGDLPK